MSWVIIVEAVVEKLGSRDENLSLNETSSSCKRELFLRKSLNKILKLRYPF